MINFSKPQNIHIIYSLYVATHLGKGSKHFLSEYMWISRSQLRINHLQLISSLSPLHCHKPELSKIISKKVFHNYLDFISIEKILSGIDIKVPTSYIWTIKGGYFHLEGVWETLNSKKSTNSHFLDWLKLEFWQLLNYRKLIFFIKC